MEASRERVIVVLSLCAAGALAIALVIPLMVIFPRLRELEFTQEAAGHIAIQIAALVLTAAAIWPWLVDPGLKDPASYFFAWRALNLFSGVSPILPVILAGIGVIWWTSMHLRRLILAKDRMPMLPDIAAGIFACLKHPIETRVEAPFSSLPLRVVPACILFILVVGDFGGVFGTVEKSGPFALLMRSLRSAFWRA